MSDATRDIPAFLFPTCYLPKPEVRYDTTEGGIGLEKDSALYQLMDTRMNGVMNDLLGFSDCKAMFLGKCLPTEVKEMITEL